MISTDQAKKLIMAIKEAHPLIPLPSIRKLSHCIGASRQTISKALAQLKDEPLINGNVQSDTKNHSAKSIEAIAVPLPSHIRIAHAIQNDIETGTLNPGDSLPKISDFTQREKTSRKSVLDAFTFLSNEGWIHKRSRRYIVGRGKETVVVQKRSSLFPPVILIMCYDEDRWPRYCLDRRNGPFCATFVHHAEQAGCRLVQIIPEQRKTLRKVPSGMTEVKHFIDNLGGRYWGTLIMEEYRGVRHFEQWVTLLCGYNKPVIWFNRNDQKVKNFISNPHFFHFHHNERASAEVALNFLYTMRYRNIAYPYHPSVPWQCQRLTFLNDLTKEYPGVSIEPWIVLDRTFEKTPENLPHVIKTLYAIDSQSDGVVRKIFQQALRETKSCCPHLNTKEGYIFHIASKLMQSDHFPHCDWVPILRIALQTGPIWQKDHPLALIIPNDDFSLRYIDMLHMLKIKVPHNVSIVSFDNAYRFTFTPLCSVDFGFSGLAQYAMNIFTNSIPSPSTRTTVSARPFIINRGSCLEAPVQQVEYRIQ